MKKADPSRLDYLPPGILSVIATGGGVSNKWNITDFFVQ